MNRRGETVGRGIAAVGGFFILFVTGAIVLFLFLRGIRTFTQFDHTLSEFLFSADWSPSNSFTAGEGKVGAAVFIVGSLITCLLSVAVVTPFALATAVLITEILPALGEKMLRPIIEIFTGIPSIVYGWMGLTVLVPWIRDTFQAPVGGYSVLAAVVVLSVMIFPTVTTMAADAILSIPVSHRMAAYGLGATKSQVIFHIVLSEAKPGILAGIILGLSRAFGEALAVAMVIGRTRLFAKGLLYPTNNITGVIASDMGNTIDGSESNAALWTLAFLLLLISMFFIVMIHFVSDRRENKEKKMKKEAA